MLSLIDIVNACSVDAVVTRIEALVAEIVAKGGIVTGDHQTRRMVESFVEIVRKQTPLPHKIEDGDHIRMFSHTCKTHGQHNVVTLCDKDGIDYELSNVPSAFLWALPLKLDGEFTPDDVVFAIIEEYAGSVAHRQNSEMNAAMQLAQQILAGMPGDASVSDLKLQRIGAEQLRELLGDDPIETLDRLANANKPTVH
jgi:hypothetical protein